MLVWIFGILAVLCGMYYIIIVVYSGFATSMAAIWILFMGFFIFMAAGTFYYKRFPDKIPVWVPVSAVTCMIAGVVVFAIIEILVFIGVGSKDAPRLDYLIVLGARIKEDGIPRSLQKRLDKAIEYAEQNPDTILVLSGGVSEGKGYSLLPECEVMKEYLVYNGISERQILLDSRSHSTVENIAYSRVRIEENQKQRRQGIRQRVPGVIPEPYAVVEERPPAIGVLTSNFHVFRAEQIAKKWGIPNIQGIASDADPVLFVHFCVRESIAILKDKLMGNM